MGSKNIQLELFQNKIIDWYSNNKREFPWRSNPSPYNVLVAEILLRQTGAWKAKDVFMEIIDKFPDIQSLSEAKVENLNKKIEPLGLHKRSKRLVDIANEIIERYGGRVPKSYDELVKIKGIGKYTANAILCFSYGYKLPVVDGSVKRIFSRCLDYNSEKRAYADKEIWSLAESILPDKKFKKYNYALLDFGAKVCTHINPLCDSCQLLEICANPHPTE